MTSLGNYIASAVLNTYTALLVVPTKISDNVFNYVGQFRSRQRIPVILVYRHPIKCSILERGARSHNLVFVGIAIRKIETSCCHCYEQWVETWKPSLENLRHIRNSSLVSMALPFKISFSLSQKITPNSSHLGVYTSAINIVLVGFADMILHRPRSCALSELFG